MNVYKLKVANISCSNCARTIKNAIQVKWPDAHVRVNITTNLVIIKIDALEEDVRAVLKKAGYPVIDPNNSGKEKQLKLEIILGVILTIPLLIGMLQHVISIESTIFNVLSNGYVQWILATPIQFYLGRRYYLGAYYSLKQKVLGMDFLVAFSSTTAYVYSVYLVFYPSEMATTYFETSALIITIVLVGKYIEERLKNKMTNIVDDLANLVNDEITLVDGTKMNVEFAPVGTKFIVNANEAINMDGIIIAGKTYINEASLSGESIPVSKEIGSDVMAGTLNVGKKLLLQQLKMLKIM